MATVQQAYNSNLLDACIDIGCAACAYASCYPQGHPYRMRACNVIRLLNTANRLYRAGNTARAWVCVHNANQLSNASLFLN